MSYKTFFCHVLKSYTGQIEGIIKMVIFENVLYLRCLFIFRVTYIHPDGVPMLSSIAPATDGSGQLAYAQAMMTAGKCILYRSL